MFNKRFDKMKRSIIALAASVLVCASCTAGLEDGIGTGRDGQDLNSKLIGRPDGEIAEGSLLVKLDGTPEAALPEGTEATIRPAIPVKPAHPEVFSRYGLDKWYMLEFDESVSPEEMAALLARKKEVKAIQYNRLLQPSWDESAVYPADMQPVVKATAAEGAEDLPFNDPYLPLQWNLINDGSIHNDAVAGADVGIKDAWRLCAGDPSVVVAIFDLGINQIHSDLRKALWVNEDEVRGNGIDDDGNGFIDDCNGFNFFKCREMEDGTVKQTYAIDCSQGSGHGTHVAGIIGAINNNGEGVSSIAGGTGSNDGVRLMSCQIFYGADGAKGTDADAALGFIYAADNGACIASCSWGHTSEILRQDEKYIESAPLEHAALQYFLDPEVCKHPALKGNIAVFAAGNQGNPYSIYPGALSDIISVTALDCRYLPAGYSNYGPGCKIAAPGGEWLGVPGDYSTMILSTGKGSQHAGTPPISDLNHQYVYMYGTSMACPHIAGVLALGTSYAGKLGKSFTREQMTSMLLTSVNDIDSRLSGTKYFYESTTSSTQIPLEKYKGQMGTGAVDAWKFLMAIEGTPSVMVKAGEKARIDLGAYCNPDLTYGISIDQASRTSLGITADPAVKDGFLEVECTKTGAGKITLSSAVGKDPEMEDGIGAMTYSREISIVSRPFASGNGGWL